MKRLVTSCALFALGLTSPIAVAQPLPNRLLGFEAAKELPKVKKDKVKEKDKEEKKLTEPPQTDLFADASSRSTFPSYFNPQMLGNWHTIFVRQNLSVIGGQTATVTTNVPPAPPTTTTIVSANQQTRVAIVPDATRGAFNIAENSSPRPQDRIFSYWNHYPSLGFGNGGPNGPSATTTTTTVLLPQSRLNPGGGTVTTTTTSVIPEVPRGRLDREVFGFEKTFFDGNASFELRAPLVQQDRGGAGFDAHYFGDITAILKYALINDRVTGNVFSTGLAVTAPIRSVPTNQGNFQDTLLQPYVGYIVNFDRFFVQGFHSVVVPTDSRDVIIAFNDIGFNYWLYRAGPERMLNFVVPSIEAHLATPLNHRDYNGPIIVPDTLVITGGVHLGVFRNGTISLGVATPVTGPRPYTVETFAQFNWRF